jgi:hypothetical protein
MVGGLPCRPPSRPNAWPSGTLSSLYFSQAVAREPDPDPRHAEVSPRGHKPVFVQAVGIEVASPGLDSRVLRDAPQSFEGEKDCGSVTRSSLVSGETTIEVFFQVPGVLFVSKLVHHDLGRTGIAGWFSWHGYFLAALVAKDWMWTSASIVGHNPVLTADAHGD